MWAMNGLHKGNGGVHNIMWVPLCMMRLVPNAQLQYVCKYATRKYTVYSGDYG